MTRCAISQTGCGTVIQSPQKAGSESKTKGVNMSTDTCDQFTLKLKMLKRPNGRIIAREDLKRLRSSRSDILKMTENQQQLQKVLRKE